MSLENRSLLYWILPALMGCSLFIQAVDATSINAAIPTIALDFQVSSLALKIALISYLLSTAMFIPVSGWLADKYGTKKIFTIALSIFALGSILCGFSQNLTMLTLFRLLQGIGGSMMLPTSRQMIYQTFDKSELTGIIAKVPLLSSLGIIIGPIIGGFLTTYISWRWIFYINIPFAIAALVVTQKYIITYKKKHTPPLDIVGMILFGLGFSCIILFFAVAGTGWLSLNNEIALIIIAAVSLLAYISHAKKTRFPLLKTRLFKIRNFRIAILNNLFMRFAVGGISLLLMLEFQLVFKFTSFQAGLLILPLPLGMLAMSTIYKKVTLYLPSRELMLANTILYSLIIASFAAFSPQHLVAIISIKLFIFGMLTNSQFATNNLLVYSNIRKSHTSKAVTIASIVQQGGLSIGIGIAPALLALYLGHSETSDTVQSIQAFKYTFLTLAAGLMLTSINIYRLQESNKNTIGLKLKESK